MVAVGVAGDGGHVHFVVERDHVGLAVHVQHRGLDVSDGLALVIKERFNDGVKEKREIGLTL